MALPPPINHSISKEDAAVLTKKYRDANKTAIKGGFFWKDQVIAMLNEDENVKGLRYYYGINESDEPVLVLTSVDENGDDLCTLTLLEFAASCPAYCSIDNPLNSDM